MNLPIRPYARRVAARLPAVAARAVVHGSSSLTMHAGQRGTLADS